MKTGATLVMTILLSALLHGQGKDTSAAARKGSEVSTTITTDAEKHDAAGRSGPGLGKGQHKMDKFVDEDGDGICDHRASGLGFRRQMAKQAGQPDARKGMKDQSGKKQHRGGMR